jgi:hypothetical protein
MSESQLGPLDSIYVEKNKIVLIILSVIPCTSCVMLILSIVCFFTAKSPESKNLAKLLLIIAAVLVVISLVAQMMMGGLALLTGGAR